MITDVINSIVYEPLCLIKGLIPTPEMVFATVAQKGGDSAQDRNHGTLRFRQPATVSKNVTG